MKRYTAIQIINSLYPTDSQYPETNAIGEVLLSQAKLEYGATPDWRDEPTEVLVRYAELCKQWDDTEWPL